MSINLSTIRPTVYQAALISTHPSIYIRVYLPSHLSAYTHLCPPVYPPTRLYDHSSIHLVVPSLTCLSAHPFKRPCAHPSIRPLIYPLACLFAQPLSAHPCISLTIYPPTRLFAEPPTRLYAHPSIQPHRLSTRSSIAYSPNPLAACVFMHQPHYPTTHLSATRLSVYNQFLQRSTFQHF
jgi:hypothetical protein